MTPEQRTTTAKPTATKPDGMAFSGYVAKFNEKTLIGNPKAGGFYEQIAPGAFTKSLRENDVRSCFNHDPNLLLARTSSGTLRLSEDATGLVAAADLPDTTTGRDVAALVKRGDITGQSFMFVAVEEEWSSMPGGHAQLRTLKDVSLLECGPVSFPQYIGTTASVRATTPPAEPGTYEIRSDGTRQRTTTGNNMPVKPKTPTIAERRARLDALALDVFTPPATHESAFRSYVRRAGYGLTEAEQRAMIEAASKEARDQGVGTGGAGGFLVPQAFLAEMTQVMKFSGGMRAFSQTVTTDTGADMPFALVDDTANAANLQPENTTLPPIDLAFTQKTLHAYNYGGELARISWALLQDTAYDAESLLADVFGRRLGRIQNPHMTNGTGIGQPTGLVPNVRVGFTLATGSTTGFATTTIAYDALMELKFALDASYRAEGASWMMADVTLKALLKLKDAQGDPIFEDSDEPEPQMLLGHPVITNNDMPVMAANARAIIFGNPRSFRIRDIGGPRLFVSREAAAEKLQNLYIGHLRSDGCPNDPQAAAALVMAAS